MAAWLGMAPTDCPTQPRIPPHLPHRWHWLASSKSPPPSPLSPFTNIYCTAGAPPALFHHVSCHWWGLSLRCGVAPSLWVSACVVLRSPAGALVAINFAARGAVVFLPWDDIQGRGWHSRMLCVLALFDLAFCSVQAVVEDFLIIAPFLGSSDKSWWCALARPPARPLGFLVGCSHDELCAQYGVLAVHQLPGPPRQGCG